MRTKALTGVEIKDAAKGQISAAFATLNVVDHDGDVTVPGAFTDGQQVRISAYNHASWGACPPVGKGVIRVDGDTAILDGAYFMDIPAAAAEFATVKAMGELQQWSYGYDVDLADYGEHDGQRVQFLRGLTVHEVSPVLLGAGIDTRTLAAKSGGLRFSDQAEQVMTLLTALADRAVDVMAMRQQDGKGLGAASTALLAQVKEQCDRLAGILAAPTPGPDTALSDAARVELLRYYRSLSQGVHTP